MKKKYQLTFTYSLDEIIQDIVGFIQNSDQNPIDQGNILEDEVAEENRVTNWVKHYITPDLIDKWLNIRHAHNYFSYDAPSDDDDLEYEAVMALSDHLPDKIEFLEREKPILKCKR